jgi:hypothetical protein
MKRTAILLVVLLAPAVVAAAGCRRGSSSSSGGGIAGTVLAGPQCPVERADSPCPDLPIQATVVVSDPSGHVVTKVDSTAEGRFSVSVDPGTYTLTVEGLAGIQSAKPVEVSVSEGRVARVTVLVDTGIR